jgi:hypothetical protein
MSIGGSSSAVADFSTPTINSIGGVPIKRLPTGEVLGAHDLQRWASNRSAGRIGAYTTKGEREVLQNWRKPVKNPEPRSNVVATIEGIDGVGWIINYPDGRTVGSFETHHAALDYVQRFRR